jgi:hypothetical protein
LKTPYGYFQTRQNSIFIEFESGMENPGTFNLEVFTASGLKLKTQSVKPHGITEIFLGELSNGMYFYLLKSEEKIISSGKFSILK